MLRRLLKYLIYSVVRCFYATYRVKYLGLNNVAAARALHPQGGCIMAVWHEAQLPGICAITRLSRLQGFGLTAIVSQSKDGSLIAHTMEKLGYQLARGSSKKGGSRAYRETVKLLAQGNAVTITVDGPTGPRRDAKLGILHLAKVTGLPIVPSLPMAAKSYVVERSWDKLKVPKLFANIVCGFFDPIMVPANASKADLVALKDRLNQSLSDAEQKVVGYCENWESLCCDRESACSGENV